MSQKTLKKEAEGPSDLNKLRGMVGSACVTRLMCVEGGMLQFFLKCFVSIQPYLRTKLVASLACSMSFSLGLENPTSQGGLSFFKIHRDMF